MTVLISTLLAAAIVQTAAPFPPVQNARVETRQAASVDAAIRTLALPNEPVWIGWRVPMIDGDRTVCSSWNDGHTSVVGEMLEGRRTGDAPVTFGATGTVRLEAGTQLVVLARVVDGRLDRLRSVDDGCPLDGGGRSVYWLSGISAAESVRYLDSLTHQGPLNITTNRRSAESAISALSLHRDATASAVLDRLSSRDSDRALRRQAFSALARTRGARGLQQLRTLLANEPDTDMRQALTVAIAESPEPDATAALLTLARNDTTANVRADAANRYVRRAGAAGLPDAMALLNAERDDNVKRRIVNGIAELPPSVSTPALLALARTHTNLVVQKEAVSALSRSKDAAALSYLEELVRQ